MLDLQKNTDAWGLICYLGDNGTLDGGDTCANQFTYLYAMAVLNQPLEPGQALTALSYLVVNGVPIRHPDPSKWYSGINRTSRDQLTPYLAYLVQTAHKPLQAAYLRRLLAQHAKHLLLVAWNTRRNHVYADAVEHAAKSTADVPHNYGWKLPDITGPDIWAIYARGVLNMLPKALKPIAQIAMHPLLTVLDLHGFISVISSVYLLKFRGYTLGAGSAPKVLSHDRRNLTLKSHCSAHHSPTLLSKLAWALWAPYAHAAANSWWSQSGEPPLHELVSKF